MAATEIPPMPGLLDPAVPEDLKEPAILEAIVDSDADSKHSLDALQNNVDGVTTNPICQDPEPGSHSPVNSPDGTDIDHVAEPEISSSVPSKRNFTPETEDGFSSSSDFSLPATPAYQTSNTLGSEQEMTLTDKPFLALQILEIISRYGQNAVAGNGEEWAGRTKFLPLLEHFVEKSEPIKMVLPAFPCKSINKVDKVLGVLPDLGEELALFHLNGLCESIADVYEPGAEVVITSDGLVYNGTFEFAGKRCFADYDRCPWHP